MSFPIALFRVKDRSMEPALHQNDFLIVNCWFRRLKVNEIVVLRHPSTTIKIVKRVSALSDNLVFVSGDNKEESEDSRSFGGVDKQRIVGKVLLSV
jgi:nickel-type superoxide dismutase maturation protease